MLRRIAFASIGLVFVLSPLVASADSTCPTISRSLSRGSRGSDVIQLQQFLIAQGYLQSGLATGYFGAMTEASVKSWQSQNGVDAVGIVGPKTRAAIARRCSNPAPDQNFSASPTSGAAPLLVSFTGNGGGRNYFGGVQVDFGNGDAALFCNPGFTCGSNTINYKYNAAGTYTAKLTGLGEGGTTTIGTATITVGGNSTSVTINGGSTIHASESDPLIQGTASAAASIRIVITNQSGGIAYDSGLFAIGAGQWSTRVNPPIPFGYYTVTAYGSNNQVLATVPLAILGL